MTNLATIITNLMLICNSIETNSVRFSDVSQTQALMPRARWAIEKRMLTVAVDDALTMIEDQEKRLKKLEQKDQP